MRLTDVNLMYAEALHAAKGNATTAPGSYNLTAEQVVNMMRDRASVPHVPGSIVGNPTRVNAKTICVIYCFIISSLMNY